MKSHAWMLGLALVLSGCTTYRDVYTPPVTENGRFCAANCSSVRQSCELSQQSLAQSYMLDCQDNYRRAMNAYNQCNAMNPPGRCSAYRSVTREINGRRETVQECSTTSHFNNCVQPQQCQAPSGGNTCGSNYNACYVACGGRYDRVEVKE